MHKKNRFVRAVAALAAATAACAAAAAPPATAPSAQLRYLPGSKGPAVLAPDSRLLLARSAAERAGLHEVGLDFRDVYGVISAESSWVPRTGMGRNGVASHGLAQFEPGTAKAVGLRDPHDPMEAVHAAARLLKEAAAWSAQRISRLQLSPEARAAKLREGVSIYYNLSTRGRAAWNGLNTASLPIETQRHILNVRAGAQQAERLHARVGGAKLAPLPPLQLAAVAHRPASQPAAVQAASAAVKAGKPQALGTIEWSGDSGRAGGAAARQRFVVWSDGKVQPQRAGQVPPGAIQWTRRVDG